MINEPVTFEVTPDRIGRHRDVKPFTVSLGTHNGNTADRVAGRIYKHAKDLLISKEFDVFVDLDRGVFNIQHGRFGKGRIRKVD